LNGSLAGPPAVTVEVPSSLRELTGGRAKIGLEAATVDEALARLREAEPLLAGRLFADDGRVRGFVNIFVDGKELRRIEPDRQALGADSVLTIVPSVAGG
jgi:molybdopterin synthase sulfur carrier subunit